MSDTNTNNTPAENTGTSGFKPKDQKASTSQNTSDDDEADKETEGTDKTEKGGGCGCG